MSRYRQRKKKLLTMLDETNPRKELGEEHVLWVRIFCLLDGRHDRPFGCRVGSENLVAKEGLGARQLVDNHGMFRNL